MTDNADKKMQGDSFAFLAALCLLVLHIVAAIIIADSRVTLPLLGSGAITVVFVYAVLFLDNLSSPSLRQFQTARQTTGLLAVAYGLGWAVALLIAGAASLWNMLQ